MSEEMTQDTATTSISKPEIPHPAFPKIPRLNRDIVVTEKIDGTNAVIMVTDAASFDERQVFAGSRNRWITTDDDNMGFAKWVKANEATLRQLGPGTHYGEWWGPGIQKRYSEALKGQEKRFYLFNVHKWGETRPACCGVVPTLYTGPYSQEAIDRCLEQLRTTGSVAAPGCMNPEGIIVFHTASGQLFKVTLEKDDAPKGMVA